MWGARFRPSSGLRAGAGHALHLSPGLVDAALSSLAGFAVSLYAVRTLEGPALGAYGLYLSAYLVASLFAQQLLFLPAQIAALKAPREERTAILGPTLWRGGLLSLAVAPFAALAGIVLSAEVATSTLVALGAGAAMLTVAVPLQDHVRSTLHLSGEHVRAAAVSGAQLLFTAASLGFLILADVPDAWTPFSALALGTAASGITGRTLARGGGASSFETPAARELMRAGMPLLPAALVQEAAVFVSAAALGTLASAAALGSAEAARVVARPIQAFSLGVSRSLAPPLMEAGEARSRSRAMRTGALYAAAVGLAGLAYLAVAGWSHPLNPFEAITPAAFEDGGLVALFIVATLVGAIAQVPRGVLLGASRGKAVLAVTVAAAVSRVALVAVLAASLDAYALPVALLLSVVLGGALALRETRRLLVRP